MSSRPNNSGKYWAALLLNLILLQEKAVTQNINVHPPSHPNETSQDGVEREFGAAIKLIILDDEDNEKICSATLLTSSKALTAWHCFDEFTFGVFGEHNGERIPIKGVILHPLAKELAKGIVLNDLAIVEFSKPISAKAATLFAKKPPQKEDEVAFYAFGSGSAEVQSSGKLRKGKMKLSSVDDHFLRARFDGNGATTCFGDSGAPVVTQTTEGPALIGVVSVGTKSNCSAGDVSTFINLQGKDAQDFLSVTVGTPLPKESLPKIYRELRALPIAPYESPMH